MEYVSDYSATDSFCIFWVYQYANYHCIYQYANYHCIYQYATYQYAWNRHFISDSSVPASPPLCW